MCISSLLHCSILFLSPIPVLTCGVVGPPTVFNCDANNPAFLIQCQYDGGPFFACKFEVCSVFKFVRKELVCVDIFSCR